MTFFGSKIADKIVSLKKKKDKQVSLSNEKTSTGGRPLNNDNKLLTSFDQYKWYLTFREYHRNPRQTFEVEPKMIKLLRNSKTNEGSASKFMKTETELDLIVVMLSKSKMLLFILLRKFYIKVLKDLFTEIAN